MKNLNKRATKRSRQDVVGDSKRFLTVLNLTIVGGMTNVSE